MAWKTKASCSCLIDCMVRFISLVSTSRLDVFSSHSKGISSRAFSNAQSVAASCVTVFAILGVRYQQLPCGGVSVFFLIFSHTANSQALCMCIYMCACVWPLWASSLGKNLTLHARCHTDPTARELVRNGFASLPLSSTIDGAEAKGV